MSLILQLFHAPQLRTLEQAVAATDQSRPATAEEQALFKRFQMEITRVYPDLSEQDVDGDDDNNVWNDGLSLEDVQRAVCVIAPKTHCVGENLMAHIATAASKADLHVLDPQNALLYRSDRMVVERNGVSSPLRTPAPRRTRTRTTTPTELTASAVLHRVVSRYCQAFAAQGFAHFHPDFAGFAVRVIGDVEQSVHFSVSERSGEFMLGLHFSFRCPRVSRVWQDALGDEVAVYLQLFGTLRNPLQDVTFSPTSFSLRRASGRCRWGFTNTTERLHSLESTHGSTTRSRGFSRRECASSTI
jgi:hypothetical protein